MSPRQNGAAEIDFMQALLKRGFVNMPRILFDYTGDLQLDYDTIGKLFSVLACMGGPWESPFGPYHISRRTHPRDYDQLRTLLEDLEQKDIALMDSGGDGVTFSFTPLYSRVRPVWEHYREQHDLEEESTGPHPAVAIAERTLGRALSTREIDGVLEWVMSYDFDQEMVAAVLREGLHNGVTRMNYLNEIARQWFEAGVRTPEEADTHAQRHRKAMAKHKTIVQYLGLKRLTGAEQALIEKWTSEWGFSNEVIMRASAEAVGSSNPLQYINKVLESWQEKGAKSVADVEQLLSDHKRKAPARGTQEPRNQRTSGSNVFLKRGKKDDKYYDHVYKPFGD